MAAVSLAADLGMGQPLESGLATCAVATNLALRLGLDVGLRQRIYDLALLQHIGCTSVSAEMASILGDELVMRQHAATLDFSDQRQMFVFLLGHVSRVNPPLRRPAALTRAVALGGRISAGAAEVCEAARMLGQRCGYDPECTSDLAGVYEHWDGSGFPGIYSGEQIPLPARVVQAATLAVSGHRSGGVDLAAELVGARRGHSLDPAVAHEILADPDGVMAPIEAVTSLWDKVIDAEPARAGSPTATEIDRILGAIADFADLKSPCLHGHSRGVAALAAAAAQTCGLSPEDVICARRAGWLHDVGRIGISSAVWGKPGPLRPHEREQVRLHPYYTHRVLDHTPYLRQLGAVAAAHHERLDGSGYFRGATATQLSRPARVLAAADVFHAMTAPRPYRPAHSPEVAARQLRHEAAAGKLDGGAVDAVLAAAGQPIRRRRREAVAGLTPRELETLQHIAGGLSIKQVARKLGIAPKTVDGHIQRVYAKIGVSTRAGATLYALQHELLSTDT